MVKHRRDHAVAFLQHNGGEIFRIPCGIIHIERRKFAFRIMLFMFRFTQEFPGDDACEQRRCSFIIFHIQPAFQKRTIRQGNVRIFAVCDHRGRKKPGDGRNRVAVPDVVQRIIPFRRKVGDCCKRKRRIVLRKRDFVFVSYIRAPCTKPAADEREPCEQMQQLAHAVPQGVRVPILPMIERFAFRE